MRWLVERLQSLNPAAEQMFVEMTRRTFQVLGVLLLSQALTTVVFNHAVAGGLTFTGWQGTAGKLAGPAWIGLISFMLYKAARWEIKNRGWTRIDPLYRRHGRKVVRILACLLIALHVVLSGITLLGNLVLRQTFSLVANDRQLRDLTGAVVDAGIVAVVLWRTRERDGGKAKQGAVESRT
jgi:hypothetical protein